MSACVMRFLDNGVTDWYGGRFLEASGEGDRKGQAKDQHLGNPRYPHVRVKYFINPTSPNINLELVNFCTCTRPRRGCDRSVMHDT